MNEELLKRILKELKISNEIKCIHLEIDIVHSRLSKIEPQDTTAKRYHERRLTQLDDRLRAIIKKVL